MVLSPTKALMPALVLSILLSVALYFQPVFAQEGKGEMTPIPMISGIEMLKVGDTAPDFSVKDLEGAEFSMNKVLAEEKGVLIFFWSIFCEPCKAELPIIQELTEEYGDKGIAVVGVAIDGAPMKEAIQALISQENYTFRVLLDELTPDEYFVISDPYGVAGTPTLYFVDSQSVVQFAKVGRASKEEVETIFKQAL